MASFFEDMFSMIAPAIAMAHRVNLWKHWDWKYREWTARCILTTQALQAQICIFACNLFVAFFTCSQLQAKTEKLVWKYTCCLKSQKWCNWNTEFPTIIYFMAVQIQFNWILIHSTSRTGFNSLTQFPSWSPLVHHLIFTLVSNNSSHTGGQGSVVGNCFILFTVYLMRKE